MLQVNSTNIFYGYVNGIKSIIQRQWCKDMAKYVTYDCEQRVIEHAKQNDKNVNTHIHIFIPWLGISRPWYGP